MEPIRLDLSRIYGSSDETFSSRISRNEDKQAVSFADVLNESIMKVNDIQKGADVMVQKLALGEVEDVSEVSIAVEKAELALRLMVQIRDKLVDAYQQIARMSV